MIRSAVISRALIFQCVITRLMNGVTAVLRNLMCFRGPGSTSNSRPKSAGGKLWMFSFWASSVFNSHIHFQAIEAVGTSDVILRLNFKPFVIAASSIIQASVKHLLVVTRGTLNAITIGVYVGQLGREFNLLLCILSLLVFGRFLEVHESLMKFVHLFNDILVH